MPARIHWLGHASFRIAGPPVVYIDPWKLASNAPTADVILITHGHYDHLSRDDIDRVMGSKTTIIMPESCLGPFGRPAIGLAPGQSHSLADLTITAVRAYNVDKAFHPAANDWLGYLIAYPDTTIYHAGDTDLIDEMKDLRCDIALLPIGGTYTMNVEQALEAAKRIGAKQVIPMHWGDVVGGPDDARRFIELANEAGIEAKILDAER